MSPKDCRYFDTCSAPLCPLHADGAGIWYPDEPICKAHKHHQGARWVANQRKIARKAKSTEGYFTKAMLNRDMVIRKGIEGANPDAKDSEAEVHRWIATHPERTPEQKAAARERGQQLQKAASPRDRAANKASALGYMGL